MSNEFIKAFAAQAASKLDDQVSEALCAHMKTDVLDLESLKGRLCRRIYPNGDTEYLLDGVRFLIQTSPELVVSDNGTKHTLVWKAKA